MAVELGHLVSKFEELWPLAGAEQWDTPGLVLGNLSQRVSRVLLSVDITAEIIAEAADGEFDLVLAHHPYLMRGVSSLNLCGSYQRRCCGLGCFSRNGRGFWNPK